MCMCLKDHLDAQKRKQHTSNLENALDFEEKILDAEVQKNEAIPLFDEENALDAAGQGNGSDHQRECKEEWILYTDAASNIRGSGAGLIVIIPTKTEYTYALRLNFDSTNNQAEYEALLVE
ncbi:reverse transcriptase domain-containing protein [Tanacetum coccineum]